jgi:hypothetical protein
MVCSYIRTEQRLRRPAAGWRATRRCGPDASPGPSACRPGAGPRGQQTVELADRAPVDAEVVGRDVEDLQRAPEHLGAGARLLRAELAEIRHRRDDHEDVVALLDVLGDRPTHADLHVVGVGAEYDDAHVLSPQSEMA